MQVSEVSESHLWSGPGPPGAACSQWALCSAPGTGSQMETRGDTTHCVHWPHWPWGTSGGPSEPRVRDISKSSETKRRFENPVTESLSSNLLFCWRKRFRIRASHWQFGGVVREKRDSYHREQILTLVSHSPWTSYLSAILGQHLPTFREQIRFQR